MTGVTIKNNIVSGLFWKFGERILAQSVSFIVSVVLARLLSPEDYGVIAMVLIFISLADVFVVSGFNTALIQNRNSTDKDFSTNFYCSLLVSLVLYVILFIAAPYIAVFYKNDILVSVIRVFALRVPLSVYNSIQHAYVSRHMLFKRFFFSTFFGTLISGIVGIVFAICGFGVWALIAQYFTNTIIDTIVLAVTIPWRLTLEFDFKSAKKMMKYGSNILIADLTGTFFNQLRGLIIGKVYTSADLAFYNKGQQLPDLLTNNISSSVMSVLFPAISNKSSDLLEVKKLTQKSTKMLAFIVVPLMTILGVVARPLVLLLYTEKWEECIPFIQILCIATTVNLLGVISLQAIKAIGKSEVLVKLEVIKKPIYIVLLLLGMQINVIAVAVTMLIYNVYGTYINMLQLKKYLRYSISEQLLDFAPSVIMSAITGVVIYTLRLVISNNFLLLFGQGILGIIVYFALAIVTKNEVTSELVIKIRKR